MGYAVQLARQVVACFRRRILRSALLSVGTLGWALILNGPRANVQVEALQDDPRTNPADMKNVVTCGNYAHRDVKLLDAVADHGFPIGRCATDPRVDNLLRLRVNADGETQPMVW